MNNPLVTIVIPCFRQAQYLTQSIECALAQTYPYLEVVVVNDGSDDDTDQVARSYGDRIRYVRREHRGLSAARNVGIDSSRGEFIVFLDADDILLPRMVESCLEAVWRESDEAIGACCGWFIVDERCERIISTGEGPDRRLTFVDFQTGNRPVHSFLVARSAVEAAGRFDETMTNCADWDFWARVLQVGGCLAPCRTPLVYYRMRQDSMSRDPFRMLKAGEGVMRKYCSAERLNKALACWHGRQVGVALVHQCAQSLRRVLVAAAESLLDERVCVEFGIGIKCGIDWAYLRDSAHPFGPDRYAREFVRLCEAVQEEPALNAARPLNLLSLFSDVAVLVAKDRAGTTKTEHEPTKTEHNGLHKLASLRFGRHGIRLWVENRSRRAS